MNNNKKYLVDENNITYRIINKEAVILNLETTYYYTLNVVGTEIWELINKKKSFSGILEFLKEEYPDVPEKRLKSDLFDMIEVLEKEQLVVSSHN